MKKKYVLCVFLFAMSAVSLSAGGFIELFPPAHPYQIVWYFMGNGPQLDTTKYVEPAVNAYLREKGFNFTVKLNCFDWRDYNAEMSSRISNHEKFDICVTHAPLYYRYKLANGDFTLLNDLLSYQAPNIRTLFREKILAKTRLDVFSKTAIDGKNYGIPALKAIAHSWGVLIRSDLVLKYHLNLSAIKKLEDLELLFSVIKKHEPLVVPFIISNYKSFFSILDWEHPVDSAIPIVLYPDKKGLQVQFELLPAEAVDFYNLLYKWRKAGYIRERILEDGDFRKEVMTDEFFCVNTLLTPGKAAELETITGFTWKQIAFTEPVITNDDLMDAMLAISATSARPELAMRFLDFFYTDKYLNNLIKFGIEGRHYIKIDDHRIIKGELFDAYNPGISMAIGNCELNYLWEHEDPDKWEKIAMFNGSALRSGSLGFSFDQAPVLPKLEDCRGFSSAVPALLLSGPVEPSQNLSFLIEKYRYLGIYDIQSFVSNQFSEWYFKNENR